MASAGGTRVTVPNAWPSTVSTMTWSIDVLSVKFSGAEWHLMSAQSDIVSDGYSHQRSVLWEPSGAPVFISRQTAAIFG